jgi:hypothetical protein
MYDGMTDKDLTVFEPAMQIADIVRQAQKNGKSGITFTFTDGATGYDEID